MKLAASFGFRFHGNKGPTNAIVSDGENQAGKINPSSSLQRFTLTQIAIKAKKPIFPISFINRGFENKISTVI